MSWFSSYIKNIAVLLIFISFLGIILPSAKYKQYITLVTGLVLILVIVIPMGKLLTGSNGDFEYFVNQIEIDVNKGVIDKERRYYENQQLEMVMATYKSDLIKQITKNVALKGFEVIKTDVAVDESEDSFGEIMAIYLEVTENIPPKKDEKLIKVEKIKIDSVDDILRTGKAEVAEDSESESTKILKTFLSDFYNLSGDNIYIKVVE